VRGRAREEGGGQGGPGWECVRESQGGGREPGSSREGESWRQRARGREGAGEGQGGRSGVRESLRTHPPSLALPHAPREGRRV
jgi:hypothetical protein